MTTESPFRALALVAATGLLLAACSSPAPAPTPSKAVYQRPGDAPATAAPTTAAPATAAPPTAAAAPGPAAPAAPTGTSDKGSRLARPTPIGQIAPEETPAAR